MTLSVLDKAVEHQKSMERNRRIKAILTKTAKIIFSFWIPVTISILIAAAMVLIFKKNTAQEFPGRIWYYFCKTFFPSLPAMMYFICK